MRIARLAVVAVSVCLSFTGIAQAAPRVLVAGPNEMVRPTSTAPVGTTSATLTAARNEFESFQVVLAGEGAPIPAIDVAVAEELTGPNGAKLAGAFTIYREAYYNSANGFTSDGELGGATGQFADALIPKVDPWYGEARTAFPIDVPAGENRAAWIDVFVPPTAAAGTYTGALAVTSAGVRIATVPVTVGVAGWTMPSTSTIRGGFDLNINKLCAAHDCAALPGGQRELAALYTRVALDNRMSLVKPAGMPSGGDGPFTTYTQPLLTGQASPGISSRLAGARVNDIYIFTWDPGSADDYKRLGAAGGFADRISFYCDELNTSATMWSNCQAAYNTANALWKAAAPTTMGDLPLTVTSNIASINWARTGGYAALVDRITTLVPLINHLNPRTQAFPGQRNATTSDPAAWTYDKWTGAGRNLWTYHSCASMGCTPNGSDVHNEWVGWPSVGIDQPASQARATSWLTYTYATSGEYYYETAKQLPTAWTTQWDSDGGNHGDGTLFYPGRPNGAAGIPAIGGTHQIPIESIRMKRIRDSREDYEYLAKARELGRGSEATGIARGLFPTAYDTTKTQGQIDGARAAVAALLPAIPPPPVVVPPAPPTPSYTCNGLAATIVGTSGNDTLRGTAGADVIVGLAGHDDIRGVAGSDTICAGDGNDTVEGGAGNDYLDGGAGTDFVEYTSATSSVIVNLTTRTASGGGGVDTLAGIEDLGGSAYADTLVGTAANNFIAGGGGNDNINGSGGADYLTGQAGADTITARSTPAVKTKVYCGTAADIVNADTLDVMSADCETIRRA